MTKLLLTRNPRGLGISMDLLSLRDPFYEVGTMLSVGSPASCAYSSKLLSSGPKTDVMPARLREKVAWSGIIRENYYVD